MLFWGFITFSSSRTTAKPFSNEETQKPFKAHGPFDFDTYF